MKKLIFTTLVLFIICVSCDKSQRQIVENEQFIVVDTLSFLHHSLVDRFINKAATKSIDLDYDVDLASEEFIQEAIQNAKDICNDYGLKYSISEEDIEFIRDEYYVFYEDLSKNGLNAILSLFNRLPYDSTVIAEMKTIFINDINNGTMTFLDYLHDSIDNTAEFELVTKSEFSQEPPYHMLYQFMLDDINSWSRINTKGGARHFLSCGADLSAAALFGATGFFIGGIISYLISASAYIKDIDYEEWTNCD